VCYCSTDIVNIIIGRKIIHMWHVVVDIVRNKGIKSLLREPEQVEPLGRPGG
jgi:hypothetical protein